MTRYAENTSVPSARSRAEIESTLPAHSAMDGTKKRAVIMFEMDSRRVRIDLRMPDPNDRAFTHTPTP